MIIRYRVKDKQRQKHIDIRTNSPSDYTVMVSKIPLDYDSQMLFQHLENYFHETLHMKLIKEDQSFINKIVFAQKIDKFSSLNEKKRELLVQMSQLAVSRKRKGQKVSEQVDKQKLAELEHLEQQLHQQTAQHIQQTSVAFVTLNQQVYAKQLLNRHQTTRRKFKKFTKLFSSNKYNDEHLIQNLELKFKRADEPDDLIWENIGYDKKEKREMKRKTVVMTCMLLVTCFIVVLGMQYFQTYMNEQRESEFTGIKGLRTAFNLLMSTIIITVNVVLTRNIHAYVQLERRKSYSNYFKSVTYYLSISMYCNTALIYFFINNLLL